MSRACTRENGLTLVGIKISGAARDNLVLVGLLLLVCWAALLRFWGQWLAPDFPTSGLWTMVAALLVWLGLVVHGHGDAKDPPRGLLVVCALLLIGYAVTYQPMPRLVSSTFAVMAVGTGMLATLPPAQRNRSTGLLLWMLASLPLGVAVNVYFGYPLRMLVGWLASLVLGGGIDVLGAGLTDGENTVFIDAPCSGIQMLRITVLMVGVIAVLTRLRPLFTGLLAALGILLAIVGNTARVCTLFVLYGMGTVSPLLHEWIGVVAFIESAVLLVVVARFLERRTQRKSPTTTRDLPKANPRYRRAAWVLLIISGVAAAGAPLFGAPTSHAATGEVRWPALIVGERWDVVAPDDEMLKFQDSYIGDWVRGELRESGRNILLRQCDAATLTLHPTEECYRAYGYTCSTMDAWKDPQGHLWSRFRADHPDGRVYTVRQCFFSIDPDTTITGDDLNEWTKGAPSWPDTASWYWAAARPGSGVKRTLAVAIATLEKQEETAD